MKNAIVIILLIFSASTVMASDNRYIQILHKADSFYKESQYSLALEKYLECIKVAELKSDTSCMIFGHIGVARCFYYMRDKKTSLKWLHSSRILAILSRSDSLLAEINYITSVMFIEGGVIDSAEYYSNLAFREWEKRKYYHRISYALAALSDLHLNQTRDMRKARYLISRADYFSKLSGKENTRAFVLMKWGLYNYLLAHDYKKAFLYTDQAEKIYRKIADKEGIAYAMAIKALSLAKLQDSTAADYFWKWFNFKDSIFQLEKASNVARFQTIYETNKKELEIQRLSHKDQINQLKIKSKNRLLLSLFFLFLLIIILGAWILSRINLKRKQKEIELLLKLQKEKERIARDLHDQVGGQLSFVLYALDSLGSNNPEQAEVITSVGQTVRNVISSIRETIWAIHDSNVTAQSLADRLKLYAKNLFKHSQVHIAIVENIRVNRALNSMQGLNLYRICQEVLNNILKHAKATEIKINMQSDEDKIRVLISDNGVGFNTQEVGSNSYGIRNIQGRAAESDIMVTINTEAGKGTMYTLIV